MSKNRVLITGAAGYIGSHLSRLMADKNYQVVGLDSLLSGDSALDNLLSHNNFIFENADIRDYDHVDHIITKYQPEHIIHLAGLRGAACDQDPAAAHQVNHDAAVYLAGLANLRKVKKFVFASTCSNYGMMDDNSILLDESSPLDPVSAYAKSKVATEEWLLANALPTTRTIVLRFATAFGWSSNMRYDLVVNSFVKDALEGRTIEIFQPTAWRPFCHLHDISQACILAISHKFAKRSPRVFNIGSTQENYTKQQLWNLLHIQFPDAQHKIVNNKLDPRNYRVDFSLAEKVLSFKPAISVADGMREVRKNLTYL